MKSKKTAQVKKDTKKTKKVVAKVTKPATKKVATPSTKKATKPTVASTKKSEKPSVSKHITTSKPSHRSATPVKIPDLFKDFYREGDRIFLREPKKFASFPDLLDLQKRGYNDFINKYINKLFDTINPVWDIA
jgi:hypothetical protein